ncbi:uncharacterized protein LOC122526224 [Polistes fuscatus]|uniref:uncharacterized protein LOC122526224 n=1 Tax=Polistes fuscatus TaxID=30207 RepID=UPI001CA8CBF2|nr:uncharacterized protein LOC122526224 [Polistes fuscatus]XP_043505413.1 uncharacterized protein LOC122526224 [Polistes fuscatus]XP_043505414.1 uncharacterized protein LOC122526224 [Polistes fuscatus]XP_043505415.1 uncharacterized protein LOC122526224 [Polistes fuscatus]XP_043505416.1 uncharacterized protein LOC122526224 [Polistes fuscatus]XP_043505417.1 uncharacterized protein LOC122526224 [Polistes fuscatus]XP_043505418.1 uncharacterized protein LOC122526224 [Polistes fuscatus]XP_04350541
MQPSSRALLSPVLLLIFAGSIGAFNSRQGECSFPPRWEGTWFQSGVRQSIVISRNELSSKGRCLHNEGDKFLLVDMKSCYRCVVIHEKHSNVLQYKETYCHTRNSLSSLCSYITGDALLYSMFREEALPVPCPFRGPMTFSYNRGHGTCSIPQSNVDTCTDDSRLLFRYQACPDVSASESAVEELECLATWKEGSSRYLVGRLHHNHASSNEDRYRCFVYEKASQTVQGNLNRGSMGGMGGMGGMDHDVALPPRGPPSGPVPEGAAEIYRVAQSGDATCNGLSSATEGSRTMTLKKVSSPGECRFPNWLTGHSSGGLTWHTLDLGRSYTFHPRNASLHVARSNGSSSRFDSGSLDGQYIPGQEDQDVKILCNTIKQTNTAPSMIMTMLVAHFTVGCRSGYMCMAFYRRDGHVIEVQTGSAISRPEEACSSPHFQHSIPYLTLVTSSPELRQCPYLGKFTVTGVNHNQRNTRESRRNQHQESLTSRHDGEKVRHAQERIVEDRRGRSKIDFELEKRRANNEYLVRERMGRRARSNRNNRSHRDQQESSSSSRLIPEQQESVVHREHGSHLKAKKREKISDELNKDENNADGSSRPKRNSKIVDNSEDFTGFADMKQFWMPNFDDVGTSAILEVDDDEYFGDYPDTKNAPKKRSSSSSSSQGVRSYKSMSFADLTRMRRDLENLVTEEEVTSETREKREEVESKCNAEITTLTVGCSTADRMELQRDCVNDNTVYAYSCHGRWIDAEGTQFVIATPLERKTTWSNDNNRPQPYRNTQRLCFMYKESGGVVSLTSSPVACQRGIPPPPPMLAFNATSTGQCMEENKGQMHRATYLTILLLTGVVVIFR